MVRVALLSNSHGPKIFRVVEIPSEGTCDYTQVQSPRETQLHHGYRLSLNSLERISECSAADENLPTEQDKPRPRLESVRHLDDAPYSIVCPISLAVMRDPVTGVRYVSYPLQTGTTTGALLRPHSTCVTP